MGEYRAAVIGLGGVGMQYDLRAEDDSPVRLTHCRGYAKHNDFELVAAVDPDPSRRAQFEERYGRPAFVSVSELGEVGQLDAVSIAAPTELHAPLALEALETCGPRALLCEKPIAPTSAEGKRIIQAAADASCLLQINYIRRFDPGVREIQRRIDSGETGAPRQAVVFYNRGFKNNASHFVDLLRRWFGPPKSARLLQKGEVFGEGDRNADAVLEWPDFQAYVLYAPVEYAPLEMQIRFARGVLAYGRGGERITWKAARPDPDYPDLLSPEEPGEEIPADLLRYMQHSLDELRDCLREGRTSVADGASALATLDVLTALLRQQPKGAK